MTTPQPPYAAPQDPVAAPPFSEYRATPAPAERRGLALAAFAIAMATVVLSLVIYVAQLLAIGRFQVNMPLATAVTVISSIVVSLLAVASLVLGIIAARGARPVMAGIAIGISVAHLASQAMSLLAPVLMSW